METRDNELYYFVEKQAVNGLGYLKQEVSGLRCSLAGSDKLQYLNALSI